eukprot:6037506-Alexandrium_andersonii.AAC.1
MRAVSQEPTETWPRRDLCTSPRARFSSLAPVACDLVPGAERKAATPPGRSRNTRHDSPPSRVTRGACACCVCAPSASPAPH